MYRSGPQLALVYPQWSPIGRHKMRQDESVGQRPKFHQATNRLRQGRLTSCPVSAKREWQTHGGKVLRIDH